MNDEDQQFAALFAEDIKAAAPANQPEAEKRPENATETETGNQDEKKQQDPKSATKDGDEKKDDDEKKEKFDWKAAAEREKAKREAKRQARETESKREAEYQAAIAKAKRLDEIEAARKNGDLGALKLLGIELDKLNTEYVAALDKDPEKLTPAQEREQARIAALEAKLAALEKERNDSDARELEQRREKTLSGLRENISAVTQAKPDDFELLNMPNLQGQEIVINLLAAYFGEHGKHLDIQEACSEVEKRLREKHGPVAQAKAFRQAPQKEGGISSLSNDLRESAQHKTSQGDEDKEFLSRVLQLHQQEPA